MRRSAFLSGWVSLFAVVTTMLFAACYQAPYGDAGVDAPQVQERFFNVGSSGTDTCPGELFGVASADRARCNTAPQRCVLPQSASNPTPLVCDCTGPAGGTGSWTCRAQ